MSAAYSLSGICRAQNARSRIISAVSAARTAPRRTIYGYAQAKALVYSKYGNPGDVLSLHSHSLSPPHSSLVSLRALACPLNPADINQIQGTYPTAPPFTSDLSTAVSSAVPGNEGCFEVLSVGSSAKTLSRGDWVIPKQTGIGSWRTHLQVDESTVVRIEKDGIQKAQAATVSINPITAWRMLKNFVDLAEGDWYIQNGANSGVGRMAIQLGKLWGYNGIAIIRARNNVEEEDTLKKELLELGATKVVTDKYASTKDFRDDIKTWTNDREKGVRLALNCVGGDAAMSLAKVLAQGGVMVTYGGMSKAPMRVGAGPLIFSDLQFRGFWVSRWSELHPEEKVKNVKEVLDLYRKGKLVDGPSQHVRWNWDTSQQELVDAVQQTLNGYRQGKGIFMFGDT